MKKRRIGQWLSAIAANSYLPGWLRGRIYQGRLKMLCVPFLNCYSCPGALGSCPIGSLQGLMAGFRRTISLYVMGFLLAVGALGGRFVCGWLCPFGLVQELVHKGRRKRRALPQALQRLKFLVLLLTVSLPLLWRNAAGLAEPYFCKYICPAGTLGGGLPLVATNTVLSALVGWLFAWKVFVLLAIIVASYFYWRPFCQTLCPLGAFYGLLNRASIWKIRFNENLCLHCDACSGQCKAGLRPQEKPNGSACLRCLECVKVCPTQALTFSHRALSAPPTFDKNIIVKSESEKTSIL